MRVRKAGPSAPVPGRAACSTRRGGDSGGWSRVSGKGPHDAIFLRLLRKGDVLMA